MPTVQMVFRRSLQNVPLARGLLQRRRPPGRLRGLRDQPRPHGQPRQLDQGRRHPAAGAHPGARGGPGTEGVDLFRRRASPSSSSTPPPPSPGSGARKAWTPQHAGLRRGDPRPERPAAELRVAPAAGRPGAGADRAARRRLAAPASRSTGTSPSASPRRIRSSPPASTSASSPTTACTTAPRRSSAGTSRPTRPAATRPAPTDAAHRQHRPCRPGEGRDLRRPDADGPRRLARRLPLRRRRPPRRLDPHPRRPRSGDVHRATAPASSPRADGAPAPEPVAYPLDRPPTGALARARRSSRDGLP